MNRTALVVDDDAPIRQLETFALESSGYEVAQASGGPSAIEYLKKTRPDLVLLDLLMPDIDGWGVLDFISTLPDPPRVILVSGLSEIVPPGHLAQHVGAYVTKPFRVDHLVKTCETVLSVELVVPASRSRQELRRTFIADATLLADNGTPLAAGTLRNMSQTGLCVEFALPFGEGETVRLAVRLPGVADPLIVAGRVAWCKDAALGIEIAQPSPETEQALRKLLEPPG
jgi:CheY-like chemotaxis protein